MSDYRMVLINSIEESLSPLLDNDTLTEVISKITYHIGDYDVSKRVTDVAVYDDANERIVKRYCACMSVDGKSKKTIYAYSREIRRFLDFLNKPIAEIGVYDIRFYLATEKERGISNRSLENIRSYLSAFFQWLSAEEIIQKNPCATVKPIQYTNKRKVAFNTIELDSLRHSCKTLRERAILEVLITSGVRASELVSLDVSDIDFQTLSVHVRHGKGDKERTTYITDVAAVYLQKYLSQRTDNSVALFMNRNGDRLGTCGLRQILNNLGKRAEVGNVHPHRFRKTFATNLAARGMSVQEIQQLLGHANIETTMVYICMDELKVKTSYRQFIA